MRMEMKKCTKCGKTYEDSEFFCEECGGELVAVPKQSEKKSPLPVIIGCGAAVVLLIVGTVVGVGLIKGKSSKTPTGKSLWVDVYQITDTWWC